MSMVSLFVESTDPAKRKKIPLSDWPTRTQLRCYDCCHTFDTVPIPMVHTQFDLDKRIFHICTNDVLQPYPVFCSGNCLMGFITHSNLRRTQLNHNAKLMMINWQDYFQLKCSTPTFHIHARHTLEMFGGKLSIHEYRKDFWQFIDQRPTTVSHHVSTLTQDMDSILWPVQFNQVSPFPMVSASASASVTTSVSTTSIVPLVQMDDPTDGVSDGGRDTVKPMQERNTTIELVTNILQQTLNTKQVQDMTHQMQQLNFAPMATTSKPPKQPPAKRQKTTMVPMVQTASTAPTAPPTKTTKSNSSNIFNHPLFQRAPVTQSTHSSSSTSSLPSGASTTPTVTFQWK
jgi:hypothetical protein